MYVFETAANTSQAKIISLNEVKNGRRPDKDDLTACLCIRMLLKTSSGEKGT